MIFIALLSVHSCGLHGFKLWPCFWKYRVFFWKIYNYQRIIRIWCTFYSKWDTITLFFGPIVLLSKILKCNTLYKCLDNSENFSERNWEHSYLSLENNVTNNIWLLWHQQITELQFLAHFADTSKNNERLSNHFKD